MLHTTVKGSCQLWAMLWLQEAPGPVSKSRRLLKAHVGTAMAHGCAV